MESPEQKKTPRIYVTSLADYNAGRLLGRWIDANQPAEAIHQQIAEMLGESRELVAEDWAIHDYENFGGLRLSEYESIESVTTIAQLIDEHGAVFAEVVNYFGGASNVEEARVHMEDGYRGAFDSVADFAQEFVEDCYSDLLKDLPYFIRYHIDFEGIGDDMELGGDIFAISCEGKIHVFDSHV